MLPEGSPFASRIRIRSLRRKLRPVVAQGEKDGGVGGEREVEGEGMVPVAPGVGWLWSKGIV